MPIHPYMTAYRNALLERVQNGMTPAEAMADFDNSRTPYFMPKGVTSEDRLLPGRNGDILVRIFRPENLQSNAPALVWFHGGGFVGGTINQNESNVVSAELAARANCLVMTVDYRLVTEEVKFPVPLHDGFDATMWLLENSESLGIDAKKVFVGGGSAGGSLAATVCLKAAEAGIAIRGAILAYPLIHLNLPEISEELSQKLADMPESMILGQEYVKKRNAFLFPEGDLPDNHFGWPGEEKNLSVFPQTLFVESEFDALRASSEQFARDLRSQGVKVESFLAEGMIHGFLDNTVNEMDSVELVHSKMAEFIKALSV